MIDRIKIGQKMRFVPAFCACEHNLKTPPKEAQEVVGEVVFVNRNRGKQHFIVEYDLNGTKLREGFCFADFRNVVHPVNG